MFNIFNVGGPDLTEYERSALVLTLLACPLDTQNALLRSETFDWLCGRAVVLHIQRDSAWAGVTQAVKPSYVLNAASQTGTDFGPIRKTFRDRMVAARIAMPFLQKALGKEPSLPPGVKRLSINEMCQLCLEDAEQSDVANVKSRIWKPSRPVIHLACATAVTMNDVERFGWKFTFEDLLMHGWLMEHIVQLAQSYEELVIKSSGLRISSDELIRVRIACRINPQAPTPSELKITEAA